MSTESRAARRSAHIAKVASACLEGWADGEIRQIPAARGDMWAIAATVAQLRVVLWVIIRANKESTGHLLVFDFRENEAVPQTMTYHAGRASLAKVLHTTRLQHSIGPTLSRKAAAARCLQDAVARLAGKVGELQQTRQEIFRTSLGLESLVDYFEASDMSFGPLSSAQAARSTEGTVVAQYQIKRRMR